VGKSCHPLTAILYLKQIEGRIHYGKPSDRKPLAPGHRKSRATPVQGQSFLRTEYKDIEDYCQMHVVFDDGMVADVFASEIVMGGVHNWLEIFANNHRTRCNMSPSNAMELYNPKRNSLPTSTLSRRSGPSRVGHACAGRDFMFGYPQEIQDFVEAVTMDREPKCGMLAASDIVAVMYAAYVSAERKGAEVEVPWTRPLAPNAGLWPQQKHQTECRISNKEFRMRKLPPPAVAFGVRYSLFDILRFAFELLCSPRRSHRLRL